MNRPKPNQFKPLIESTPESIAPTPNRLASLAKAGEEGCVCIVLVGHVTKEGALAGPRVLEHMVDTVLYLRTCTPSAPAQPRSRLAHLSGLMHSTTQKSLDIVHLHPIIRPQSKDKGRTANKHMKSQDIFLLIKLLSLEKRATDIAQLGAGTGDDYGVVFGTWQDWSAEALPHADLNAAVPDEMYTESWLASSYSVRGLATSTGISKSEVSAALKRCSEIGLAKLDRYTQLPAVNRTGLWEFLVYGLRYVYPAKPGELTRGITTGVGAPIFANQLMSGGDLLPVWPDPTGNTKGLAITPLFKTVPHAVKRDPHLYALLALTDALRLGKPRERNFAAEKLSVWMNLQQ